MKTELPEVKRCCFCIPLRHGLLVMGLLKIILSTLYLITVIVNLVWLARNSAQPQIYSAKIVVSSILSAFLILDVCGTLIFLVGGCMKNEKIFRYYFVFSIVMLCIIALFFLWSAGKDLYMVIDLAKHVPEFGFFAIDVLRIKILLGSLLFGFQTYMIILIKNEIEKLKDKAKPHRFTNATVEGIFDNTNIEVIITPSPTVGDHTTGDQHIGVINQSGSSQENVDYNELTY